MTKQELINEIIYLEWEMMISITAIDDPDGCREDPATFRIMRESQHLIWSEETLASYLDDLKSAQSKKVNMAAERYAHMMKVTHPDEYEMIKKDLRPVTYDAAQLVEKIMAVFTRWNNEVDRLYPNVRSFGRPATENGTWTSVDTYLRGELLTYSVKTLNLCLQDVYQAEVQSVNLSEMTLECMARFYGFKSLNDMEHIFYR
ncbi:MAG: DUF4125 family protein [Syntrophomonadaceae bacterium]|nr:DUF4125 family protein [Syntrophomonadaceae bacterium]